MSKYGIWCMMFTSLVSMRLHPRSIEDLGVEGSDVPDERVRHEVLMCAHIADVMLRMSENRVEDLVN